MAISTSLILKFDGAAVQKGLAMVRKSFVGLGNAGMAAGKMMLAPFIKLAAVMAPIIGFAAIGKIGTDALKAASDMETLQTQFAALLQSEKAANDLIEKLRKLNVESPLQVDDFAKGAKALLGVGMNAEDATDALDKMSNISMGKSENFESLVRAFSQVKSAGRLMGQEVLQFVNAGFNPLQQISLKTGESMVSLKKRMEDGGISFKEVGEAIAYATAKGGLFNGMNQKVAATTEGKLNKLKDSWNQLLIAFGTPINDELRPLIDKLTDKFSTLTGKAKEMGEQVGGAITIAFNAFQSGEIGTLIQDAFMVGVTKAGEYLIGVMGFIGNELLNKVKDALKLMQENSILGKAKSGFAKGSKFLAGDLSPYFPQGSRDKDPFVKTKLSLTDALGATSGMLQSGEYAKTLSSTAQRNRQGPPPGYRFVKEGESSIYSDASGRMVQKLTEAVEQLKNVNRSLAPTP